MHPTWQDPQHPFTNAQRARSARHLAVAAALVAVLTAPAARAADGVLEISHVCATQTGCFAGDTAGYPVTITASGSYQLTSDLVLPDENTVGVQVDTHAVALDLGGFAIVRSGCQGPVSSCIPASGFGRGVYRTTSGLRGLSVTNGSVVGMGQYGIVTGADSEVSGVEARWNRLDGIFTGNGSVITDNRVAENGGRGLVAGAGSTVTGNAAHNNGDDGISASVGATVSGNSSYANDGDGIVASTGCTVSGNTAYSNDGDGIDVGMEGLVQRNNAARNDGYGLRLGGSTAYRENVVNSNGAGSVNGGLNMFSNSCNGTTACP